MITLLYFVSHACNNFLFFLLDSDSDKYLFEIEPFETKQLLRKKWRDYHVSYPSMKRFIQRIRSFLVHATRPCLEPLVVKF